MSLPTWCLFEDGGLDLGADRIAVVQDHERTPNGHEQSEHHKHISTADQFALTLYRCNCTLDSHSRDGRNHQRKSAIAPITFFILYLLFRRVTSR